MTAVFTGVFANRNLFFKNVICPYFIVAPLVIPQTNIYKNSFYGVTARVDRRGLCPLWVLFHFL